MYMHIYIYIYTYIYVERERELCDAAPALLLGDAPPTACLIPLIELIARFVLRKTSGVPLNVAPRSFLIRAAHCTACAFAE